MQEKSDFELASVIPRFFKLKSADEMRLTVLLNRVSKLPENHLLHSALAANQDELVSDQQEGN